MGSEMCIRDRLLLGGGALAARKLIIDRRGGADEATLATAGGTLSDAGAVPAAVLDAAAPAAEGPGDAGPRQPAARRDAGPRHPVNNGGGTGKKPPEKKDAGPTPEPSKRTFTLRVNPSNVDALYRVGEGPWLPIQGQTDIQVPAGDVTVSAKSDKCCKPKSETIAASAVGGTTVLIQLPRKPATVAAKCAVKGAEVLIADDYQPLGQARTIKVDETSGSAKVKVEFTLPDGKYNKQDVVVEAGESKDVTCGEFK